jgi:hypothetical protein
VDLLLFDFVVVVVFVEENDQGSLGLGIRRLGVGAGERVRPRCVRITSVVGVIMHAFACVAGRRVWCGGVARGSRQILIKGGGRERVKATQDKVCGNRRNKILAMG